MHISSWNLAALLSFLLVQVFPGAGKVSAQTCNPWRRDVRVALANPIQSAQELVLVNDLNGDGKPEAVRRYTDLHRGKDAEFRIYEVVVKNGQGEFGQELARIKTADDYCLGIELRDCDGDGINEILCTTIGRDGTRRGLHIIRVDKESKTYIILHPDKAMGQLEASYVFTPKTASNPASLTVISASSANETIFSPVSPVAGQVPRFWMRQVYYFEPGALVQNESVMHETPYYVLTRTLQALQRKDLFAAYKYMFADAAYHDFKQKTLQLLPHLCAKQSAARFLLIEWGLEFYRDARTQGWLTFTHVFEEGGRERQMMYQAFMRKVYDEWKITLIRKIQEK